MASLRQLALGAAASPLMRYLPPIPPFLRRAYDPPWRPRDRASIPDASEVLKGVPGVRRDRAEEERRFRKQPLEDWTRVYKKSVESVQEHGGLWLVSLLNAPRYSRATAAVRRTVAGTPAAPGTSSAGADPGAVTADVRAENPPGLPFFDEERAQRVAAAQPSHDVF